MGAPGPVELERAAPAAALQLHQEPASPGGPAPAASGARAAVLGEVDVAPAAAAAPAAGPVLTSGVQVSSRPRTRPRADKPVLLDSDVVRTRVPRESAEPVPAAAQASLEPAAEQPATPAVATPTASSVAATTNDLRASLLRLQIECARADDAGAASVELCRRARNREPAEQGRPVPGPPPAPSQPDASRSPDIPAPPPAPLYVQTGR
jgi:hypothetical protein